jgi:CBS domain-containing protein
MSYTDSARSLRSGQLISVAGLVGRVVRNQAGAVIGRVKDVVTRWDESNYPLVTGLVVRVGRRSTVLHAQNIADLRSSEVRLRSARLDLEDFQRRAGEITLVADILDRQLIDVSGVRLVRASDVYITNIGDTHVLVGVDVGFQSLVRRLGPARLRVHPTPSRVIDWAAVQPISRPGEPLRLGGTRQALHRLRPADLAGLIEELGTAYAPAFVAALDTEVAADALEEMDPGQLDELLSEMPRQQAATLVAAMAPDEASEVLREMDDEDRTEVLSEMSHGVRRELSLLLAYDKDTAGSMMTTAMVIVPESKTVGEVIAMLPEFRTDRSDIDGVLLVDSLGRLVDDVSLFELLITDRETPLSTLVAPPYPVTVTDDASIEDVLTSFVDSRGSSLVVVDSDGRPVGRILADDVIDALLEDHRLGKRAS